MGNKLIWEKADNGRLWFSFLERGKEGRMTRAGVAGRGRRIWNCPHWLRLDLNTTTRGLYIRCGLAAARGLVAGPSAIATAAAQLLGHAPI